MAETLPENNGAGLRTRRGKIARMPVNVREEVNRRLQNGESASAVATWLNALPEARAVLEREFDGLAVNEDNISRWRAGGFVSWQNQQDSLDAIAILGEETAEIQDATKEGLTNRIALVLAARMAIQLRRLESLPEGEEKGRVWQELLNGLMILRRGDLHAERLRGERERFEHRKFKNAAELEECFFRWVRLPENKARVKAILFAPDTLSGPERAERDRERAERVKAALGIHSP